MIETKEGDIDMKKKGFQINWTNIGFFVCFFILGLFNNLGY